MTNETNKRRRELLKAGGVAAIWTLPIGSALAMSSNTRCTYDPDQNLITSSAAPESETGSGIQCESGTYNSASGRCMKTDKDHANGRPFGSEPEIQASAAPVYTYNGVPITASCWSSINPNQAYRDFS